MNNQVEIQIPSELSDISLVEELTGFFVNIASPVVHIKPERGIAAKSWEWNVIEIGLTIVGTWAAERFVLDPLADRVEEWRRGTAKFWEDPRTRSRLHLLVRFQESENKVEFEYGATRNQAELQQAWRYIRQASEARARALENGVVFDAIRMLPSGTGKMLAIGYSGKRPTHVVDLETKSIKTIPSSGTEEREREIDALLWKLTVLIRARDYLAVVAELGYDVPDERIQDEEHAIEAAKRELQG